MTEPTTHIIDAKRKALGRVASEAAHVLMGKHHPSFRRNIAGNTSVSIINASALALGERVLTSKVYERYSGYPGGRATRTMREVITRHGHREVLRHAVRGMLPKNRLRALRMKRLTIQD